MSHPNLSNVVNRNIAQSEIEGGVWLKDLAVGRGLEVQTRNTLYKIRKAGDAKYTIEGHAKYCPTPTEVHIAGSTWGGSMIKVGWVGRGMHLEFYTKDEYGPITTTAIEDITEVA